LTGGATVRQAKRMEMIDTPSPNFDERSLPVSMIVLHYLRDPAPDLARSQGLLPLPYRRGRPGHPHGN